MQLALETQSDEVTNARALRTDGVPSIENSSVQNRACRKGLLSSSKFLLDQNEEDER
jgi:hypothetical protein